MNVNRRHRHSRHFLNYIEFYLSLGITWKWYKWV